MNPRPNFAARRAAALVPPATSMYGPPAVAEAGVTWMRLPPWSTGSPVSSRSRSASDSSANFPRSRTLTPEMLVFLSAVGDTEGVRDAALADDVQDTDLLCEPNRIPEGNGHGRQQNGQLLGAGGDGGREDVRNPGRCPSSVA